MIRLILKFITHVKSIVKGQLKIHIIYPKKFTDCTLMSLLSAEVEALLKEDTRIDKDVVFASTPDYIGRHVYVGKNTYIGNCSFIGDFSSISMDVKIGLNEHALDHVSTNPLFYAARRKWVRSDTFNESGSAVYIGHDVLISANAIVLNGVSLGTGCVVGAGAVVTKDVPPYAIVAGVPAKILRYRFDENIRSQLLSSRWWELNDKDLKEYSKHYNNTGEFLNLVINK